MTKSIALISYSVGAKVAMRHVLVLPPKESYKRRVNLDSLYGMGIF